MTVISAAAGGGAGHSGCSASGVRSALLAAALSLACAAPAAAQEASWQERLQAAESAEQVEGLARRMAGAEAKLADWCYLARAWMRVREFERAEELLANMAPDRGNRWRLLIYGSLAECRRARTDDAGAWRAIELAASELTGHFRIEKPGEPERYKGFRHGVRAEVAGAMAKVLERMGEWRAARAHWGSWNPFSGCGTGIASIRRTRHQHIARCEYEMGLHPKADRRLMYDVSNHGSAAGPAWSSAVQLLEAAVRFGRLAKVRAAIAEAPEHTRTLYGVPLELCAAYEANDAARIPVILARAAEAAAPGPTVPQGPKPPAAEREPEPPAGIAAPKPDYRAVPVWQAFGDRLRARLAAEKR